MPIAGLDPYRERYTQRVGPRLSPQTLAWARNVAQARGWFVADLMREALKFYLSEYRVPFAVEPNPVSYPQQNYNIGPKVHAQLQALAKVSGVPMSLIAREALVLYLENQEATNGNRR